MKGRRTLREVHNLPEAGARIEGMGMRRGERVECPMQYGVARFQRVGTMKRESSSLREWGER